MIMRGQNPMGRFSVELTISNYDDVRDVQLGRMAAEKVRSIKLKGLVDTGATRLVLPEKVAQQLGLPTGGEVGVRYADQRRETRPLARNAWVQLQGRESIFNAVLEPNREDALIGAIVLEELDFVVDCAGQKLEPRDPKQMIAEIE
jgi:predicted aspartyl protease